MRRADPSCDLTQYRVAEPPWMRGQSALQPIALGGTRHAGSLHRSRLQCEGVGGGPHGVPQDLAELRQNGGEGVRTRSKVCTGPKGAVEFWHHWGGTGRQVCVDHATAVDTTVVAELRAKRRDAKSGQQLAEE